MIETLYIMAFDVLLPGLLKEHYEKFHDPTSLPVWKSNLQPDFNVRVIEQFGPDSFAVLRGLDESNRFVQKSAKSTSI